MKFSCGDGLLREEIAGGLGVERRELRDEGRDVLQRHADVARVLAVVAAMAERCEEMRSQMSQVEVRHRRPPAALTLTLL